jgi:hypothetical protein
LVATHALTSLQISPAKIEVDDSDLEEEVQGYLDEASIKLTEDDMTVLMWCCIGVRRRPGRNSSFFVRLVLAISVDTLLVEHAEGLYALATRNRGDDNEQEKRKSPSTICSKTSSSRPEVIPLDRSGLNSAEMPHPPQRFNDAGSSVVIAIESDSLATADTAATAATAETTKSSGGQAVP